MSQHACWRLQARGPSSTGPGQGGSKTQKIACRHPTDGDSQWQAAIGDTGQKSAGSSQNRAS
eukprot:5614664-Karenia_brevis.AAC.1